MKQKNPQKRRKTDLNQSVTKGEFGQRLYGLKVYIDQRFNEIEKRMYTKEDHAKFMIWMDEAMTELRDARHGRDLYERQMLRLDDKVDNHEKRICALEHK